MFAVVIFSSWKLVNEVFKIKPMMKINTEKKNNFVRKKNKRNILNIIFEAGTCIYLMASKNVS